MTATAELTVVLPLFRTRRSVPELTDRLHRALDGAGIPHELIFVDDACPENSFELVPVQGEAGRDGTVRLCRHPQNRGQQAALHTGMAAARTRLVALMDADLQDDPADLPRLALRARQFRSGEARAVAAGRRGGYERRGRRLTGRAYRVAFSILTAGRIPPDAGLFMVMTSELRDRIVALGDPAAHVLAATARVGGRVETIPLVRHVRQHGTSSYRSRDRLRAAARSLVVVTPLYRHPPRSERPHQEAR